jgi:hypothetical protein
MWLTLFDFFHVRLLNYLSDAVTGQNLHYLCWFLFKLNFNFGFRFWKNSGLSRVDAVDDLFKVLLGLLFVALNG